MGKRHRLAFGGIWDTFAASDEGIDHLQDHRQFARRADLARHSKIENTVRYLGVDIEDALTLAESTEI
jgi:hypothetical protein